MTCRQVFMNFLKIWLDLKVLLQRLAKGLERKTEFGRLQIDTQPSATGGKLSIAGVVFCNHPDMRHRRAG